jgi:hypothetical protein
MSLAERIVHVPELYEAGTRSTAALLKDASLPEADQLLSTQQVEDALRREPELTDLWLERGGDQRLAGGWGIERDGNGAYRVQNFSNGKGLTERNRFRACAEFVVHYVSFIGDVLRRWR